MKLHKKMLVLLGCCIIAGISLQAQVTFKLTKLADGETYQVSLISEVTYQGIMNTTSTAQVTLKVPTGGLEVDRVINLQAGTEWEPNSLTVAPDESPEYDYVSFGLVSSATKNIPYVAGVEVPLFSFINITECQGKIALFDNKLDAFKPPNSRLVNVGNQITILGANGDAYIGNEEAAAVLCGEEATTAIEQIDQQQVNLSIFPNPAKDYIFLNLDWARKKEEVAVNVLDISGKRQLSKTITINQGNNHERIELQSLSQGNYFIELSGTNWKITTDQFVKMNH